MATKTVLQKHRNWLTSTNSGRNGRFVHKKHGKFQWEFHPVLPEFLAPNPLITQRTLPPFILIIVGAMPSQDIAQIQLVDHGEPNWDPRPLLQIPSQQPAGPAGPAGPVEVVGSSRSNSTSAWYETI